MNNEMKLFTSERLNSYRNDPRIIAQLNGYKLITYEEFKFGNSTEDIQEKLLEIVTICNLKNDEGNISKYCIDTVNLLMNNEKFDALFAMKETTSGNFEVDGFVITELGECSSKPNIYAVNLICTQNKFKAAILLGGYIYCIKQLPNTQQHEAILELANHYTNVAGFISYTKMGFTKNMNLLAPDCFWDLESINLPMYIDTFTFSYFYRSLEDIILVVIGSKKLKAVNDVSGYYELYNNGSGISDEKKKEEKEKFEDEWCAHLKTLSIKTDETKFWEKYNKDDKENISEYPCLKNYSDYPYVESNLKKMKKQKLLSPLPLLSSRRRLTPGRYNFESKRSSKRSKKRSSKRSKKRSFK